MNLPLVTAVVLCYNTGDWVVKTIQSIINNGYKNLEIICIDDASTDLVSQRKLIDFHKESNFGHLIINSSNIGIPASANKGLSMSNGKYMFIIGDDCIIPGKLEADVYALEHSSENTALVHSIMQYVNYDFSIKYPHFSPTYPYPIVGPDLSTFDKVLSAGGGVSAPTSVFKTKVLKSIDGWDENLKYEDKPLWLKLSSLGYTFLFRPEVTVLYRKNNSQASNQFLEGDLVYQMQVYAQYSEFEEAKKQMRRILFISCSAKIDGINDLSKCVKIYRERVSFFSPLALLAKTGTITAAIRIYRITTKLTNEIGFSK